MEFRDNNNTYIVIVHNPYSVLKSIRVEMKIRDKKWTNGWESEGT
jgi:hypothetical protein